MNKSIALSLTIAFSLSISALYAFKPIGFDSWKYRYCEDLCQSSAEPKQDCIDLCMNDKDKDKELRDQWGKAITESEKSFREFVESKFKEQ